MTHAPTALHAWVDESMRVGSGDAPGHYVLAAVLLDPGREDHVRAVLRSLTGRARRLHWRDEAPARRTLIISTIATLDVCSIVAVGTPMASAKQERARRICTESLLPALEERGVTTVVREARTPRLVAKDHQHLLAVRGRRLISGRLRVDVARPAEEPLLWLPDAVAGAVNAAHSGRRQWLDLVRDRVVELDVAVR